ncbi:MAG TPA: HAMP domain-containing sensor histidine kinase [Candidatus Binataceae bacterium]|nr:HAMP domain-containing sensor histidine kinase [Candidatus Binataceae bacterium]
MANRTSSGDDSGSKPATAIESRGSLRQWVEGMRLEVLANLAHELRTPLQVLLGYVDILRDEWAEKFDPEPRAMLERMNSNLHDLSQTVDNIMEFVMSEAGATSRVEEDVSISSLVNDLEPAIEAAKGAKEVTLKIDLEHAPQTIHTSRRPLRSILSNLVLNAIKFTERGSVTVRISSSRVRGAEPGMVLEVADTGLGMSPALIKQAAEPFAQLSQSSARKYRGLGLGLAVVHRNVSALGAKLEVSSTPGRGSRFVVRIPPTSLATQQIEGKMGKRIFGRTGRGKHAPTPAAIEPPSPSPRKAAGGVTDPIVFI